MGMSAPGKPNKARARASSGARGVSATGLTSLGERLRLERKRLGLSQEEFALKTGIHRRSLVNYEADRVAAPTEVLESAAQLGADITFLHSGIRQGQRDDFAANQGMLLGCLLVALGHPEPDELVVELFHRSEENFKAVMAQRGQVAGLPSVIFYREEARRLVESSPVLAARVAHAEEIDIEAMSAAIGAIQKATTARGATIGAEKFALLVAAIYRQVRSTGQADPKMVADAVALAL